MVAGFRIESLVAAVRAAGGIIRCEGEVIELAAPAPLPTDLVARIREAKPFLLAALADRVADWHARHREALAYWRIFRRPEEAASLAWGELQNRWHWLHGGRVPLGQCAGCGEPINSAAALDLGDGNRAHLDNLDCLIRYGERWRDAANRALIGMALKPPGDKQ